MEQNQYNGLSGTHGLMMGGKTPNNCYCDKKVLHVSLKFSLHGHQQTTVFKALLSLHRTQDSERLLTPSHSFSVKHDSGGDKEKE